MLIAILVVVKSQGALASVASRRVEVIEARLGRRLAEGHSDYHSEINDAHIWTQATSYRIGFDISLRDRYLRLRIQQPHESIARTDRLKG